MAKLVIYGELGSKEVKWQIPNFLERIQEIEKTPYSLSLTAFTENQKPCILKLCSKVVNAAYPKSANFLTIYHLEAPLTYDSIISVESGQSRMEFDLQTNSGGSECFPGVKFPRMISLTELKARAFFDSGTLTVVWTPVNPVHQPITKPKYQSSGDGIADDLEKAFSNMQFSDIQLLCNGEKFDCHKVILAARSPVFNAMFIHEMKENINKEVKLDSMKPKILKEMLSYIYSGKVKDLKETCDAMELLKVADEYQLEGLKDICGSFLSSNLKADNALDLLTLAESCNENHLKKSTMDWLVRNQNIKSLMKTKRWEELEEKFPRLLVDVMKVVVDHKL